MPCGPLNSSSKPGVGVRSHVVGELLIDCLAPMLCLSACAADSSRPQGAHRGTRLWRVCSVTQNVRVLWCAVLGRRQNAAHLLDCVGQAAVKNSSMLLEAAAAAPPKLRLYHSLLLPAPPLGGCVPVCCLSVLGWCPPPLPNPTWCRFKQTLDLIPGASLGHLREHKQKDLLSGFQSIFAGQAPDPAAAGAAVHVPAVCGQRLKQQRQPPTMETASSWRCCCM